MPEIADAIQAEEIKFFDLLKRAEHDIPMFVSRHGMSGKTLAVLHHTHGYDLDTVAGVMGSEPSPQRVFSAEILREYEAAMEMEQTRSRDAQKREVITGHLIQNAEVSDDALNQVGNAPQKGKE
jgi:alanyl-tRNA synthetase